MLHYRKTKLAYNRHNKTDRTVSGCPFCPYTKQGNIIEENETMYIITNRVSYDMFEGRRVIEHLMVIPKEHRTSIADFTSDECRDHMKLLAKYESEGYNIYARSADSPSRSVKHQHTHLIKLIDRPSRLIIFAKKPYVLIDI